MSAADAVTETQNQAATETSASSGIDGSSAGPQALTGATEPPHADSDALTAVQLAALASKTLHGGPDQASDALVARYANRDLSRGITNPLIPPWSSLLSV